MLGTVGLIEITKTGHLGGGGQLTNSYTSFKVLVPVPHPSGCLPNPPRERNPTFLALTTWGLSGSVWLYLGH